MSEPSKYTIHTQSSQIIEHNAGTVIGIQNSYSTDLEVQEAVADLKTLLTQLQTQHPQITSEVEALAIIDVEFTKLQQSPTSKLTILRQQLLNPERHAQALKAAVGEIAKHYLEESVLAKATLTYLDKLSETPDQGV
jgi:Ribonuclease G/E